MCRWLQAEVGLAFRSDSSLHMAVIVESDIISILKYVAGEGRQIAMLFGQEGILMMFFIFYFFILTRQRMDADKKGM